MAQALIRLTDLRHARVKTLDGDKLGRVYEIHADGGRIVAIVCGAGSFIERLTAKNKGRRIPWESVVRLGKGLVIIVPDPSRRKKD